MKDQLILIIAVDEAERTRVNSLVSRLGYSTITLDNGDSAMEQIRKFNPAIVITELLDASANGVQLLQQLQESQPWTQVILLTTQEKTEETLRVLQQGAYDYLIKPLDPDRMKALILKALDKHNITLENYQMRRQLLHYGVLGKIVGSSPIMREILHLVELAAPHNASVLISGEEGSGKELVSRTIHELSQRRNAPFMVVNCSALRKPHLESEIFGHERGAFPEAVSRKHGLLELSNGGTLFVEEILDLDKDTQTKLLRFIEEKQFKRLGGEDDLESDVRVVCSTSKDLLRRVSEGHFRSDLFYRLNVISINLPPLRERREDIHELIDHFINLCNNQYNLKVLSVDNDVLKTFQDYYWPGNIQELRNAIERSAVVCEGEVIRANHLPHQNFQKKTAPAKRTISVPLGSTIEKMEREMILQTLTYSQENKTKAAKLLGISLKTLYNKLNKYKV